MWTRRDSHLEARPSAAPPLHPTFLRMTEAHPWHRRSGKGGAHWASTQATPCLSPSPLGAQASETNHSCFSFSSRASPKPQRREGVGGASSEAFPVCFPSKGHGHPPPDQAIGAFEESWTEEQRWFRHSPFLAASRGSGWLSPAQQVGSQGIKSCFPQLGRQAQHHEAFAVGRGAALFSRVWPAEGW